MQLVGRETELVPPRLQPGGGRLRPPAARGRCRAPRRAAGGCRSRPRRRSRRGRARARGRGTRRPRRQHADPSGTPAAQQCTTPAGRRHRGGRPGRRGLLEHHRLLDGGSLPNPVVVGSPPCSTAGREGSSTWTTTVARQPGGHGVGVRPQPLGEGLGEVGRAPGSTTARSPRLRSSEAASVHGPAADTLNGPVQSPATSCSASRSRSRNSCARRRSWPGRGTRRHPAGVRSTATSTSRPAVRPTMSAPAPRPAARAGGRTRAAPPPPGARPRRGRCPAGTRRPRPAPTVTWGPASGRGAVGAAGGAVVLGTTG